MMSLVEQFKTVPGDIFGACDSRLKQIVNILIFHFYLSKTITDTIRRFNFDVQIVLIARKKKNS